MTIELNAVQLVLGLIVSVSAVVGVVYGAVRSIARPAIAESIERHVVGCPVRASLEVERRNREEAIGNLQSTMQRIEEKLDALLLSMARRGA